MCKIIIIFVEITKQMIGNFEETIAEDLRGFLSVMGRLDEHFPEMPDIEEKWQSIAEAYMADGIREFANYPVASLGWIMYVGMAVAKYWDAEWEIYGNLQNLYGYIRDKRGYDELDEYVREEVLMMGTEDREEIEVIVGECAQRTLTRLRRAGFEAGSKDALLGYVACLHQLYLMGAAMQMKRMGYRMVKMGE